MSSRRPDVSRSEGTLPPLAELRSSLLNRWPELKELWSRVAPTGIWLVVALLSSVALSLAHSPIAPLPGVVTILLVPGAAVLSILNIRPANTAARFVLSACLSMIAIMVVGGAASLLGPPIGIAQPLDAAPQSFIWFILAVVILATCAIKRRDPVRWAFEGIRRLQVVSAIGCSLLVVVSILAVARLNYSGNTDLAIFSTTLDVVVLLAAIVGEWRRPNRWPLSTLLYATSLALLVATSLRGGHLYGWDVQEEFAVAAHAVTAGVWRIPSNGDPYASMLSLTVLPAILHSLVKLHLLAFFQLVVPAILALLPVAVYSTIRSVPRWITSGRTSPRPGLALAVVVGLIISSVAFSSELVSITRQAMALTMLTALVMVILDRTMLKRPAEIIVGVLVVGLSFTHYTTSYLVAVIFLCAWVAGWVWSRGLIGIPKDRVARHRRDVQSRKIINLALVIVAIAAAFGWNLGITRNYALKAPASAITANGAGISASTQTASLSLPQFEHLLISELRKTDSFIVPVRGSNSVHLAAAHGPHSSAVLAPLFGLWNNASFLATESLWVLLGIALLYGVFSLARRRSYDYTADLVGLGVAGLLIGGVLRFSGTLAAFYSPERAAIFTAILLAAPLTLLLDDVATIIRDARSRRGTRTRRILLGAGMAYLTVMVVFATGLGSLIFGGSSPGSLSARDVNVEDFTVSASEMATARWLRDHVNRGDIVQSDLYGQLVLNSEPGGYALLDEIVPPEVDRAAYIYISTTNLKRDLSQAAADNGVYQASYRSNIQFFNRKFYVVYSTGSTRVYH